MAKEELYERTILAIVFFIAFAVIGYFAPKLTTYFIPTRYYYHFLEPAKTTKNEFVSCEPIRWEIARVARDTMPAHVVERLSDGIPVKDRDYDIVINTPGVPKKVLVEWDAGCLPSDTYKIEGIITFEVNGVKKSYKYETNSFRVLGR